MRSVFAVPQPRRSPLFPYTTLFRSVTSTPHTHGAEETRIQGLPTCLKPGSALHPTTDRKKHTSELQSREKLVCRLLLEKKTVSIAPASVLAVTMSLMCVGDHRMIDS